MEMKVIDETLLDATTRNAEESPRLRKNYNFHKSESDPVNWLLNGLQRGTFVQPHRHLAPERDEMVVVLRGRVASFVFDEAGNVTQKAVIDPQAGTYGFHIPAGELHGLLVLQDGTVVYEVKQGPFAPLTPGNVAPWSPSPDDAGAVTRFLERLEAELE